jgi:hypothetical protein
MVLNESPMPQSPLGVRSRIFWGGDALVAVLLAYYNTLECWIEYAYLLGMKMSCCPVPSSRALLIGPGCILSEVVVCCSSIAPCAPVLEREPRFIPQSRPCGRTVLKSRLRWSANEGIDRWVLAGGIEPFSIAAPDHADSSGFVVRISIRANLDDRVVIDGVLIGSRAGSSIKFVVTDCLTTAWNIVAEFSRPRWNLKPIVVVHHSSCSWVECSRSSSSPVVNDSVPNRNRIFLRNFSLYIHGAISSPWWISALPPFWHAYIDVLSSDI